MGFFRNENYENPRRLNSVQVAAPSSPVAPVPWRRSPVVAKIRQVRRSRQVCHPGRLPIQSGGPHAGPSPPAKIHENPQSPQAAVCFHILFFMRFLFPIRPGGLPYAGAVSHVLWHFPCLVAFPIRFRGFPCDSAASHTQAISPYGIAVFPYGHTPDAFPHTFWQIPTGRPSPHTFFADLPYNPQALKNWP